jgi:hypothetical protein
MLYRRHLGRDQVQRAELVVLAPRPQMPGSSSASIMTSKVPRDIEAGARFRLHCPEKSHNLPDRPWRADDNFGMPPLAPSTAATPRSSKNCPKERRPGHVPQCHQRSRTRGDCCLLHRPHGDARGGRRRRIQPRPLWSGLRFPGVSVRAVSGHGQMEWRSATGWTRDSLVCRVVTVRVSSVAPSAGTGGRGAAVHSDLDGGSTPLIR